MVTGDSFEASISSHQDSATTTMLTNLKTKKKVVADTCNQTPLLIEKKRVKFPPKKVMRTVET